MQKLFDLLHTYDDWLLRLTRAAIEWAEEWLSLSRKRLEQVLLVLTVVTASVFVVRTVLSLPGQWVVVSLIVICLYFNFRLQFSRYKMPPATRQIRSREWFGDRVVFQFIALLNALPPHYPGKHDAELVSWYVATIVFNYVIASDTHGERGRKRKLALAKLKELFGVSWMPQPVGAPL